MSERIKIEKQPFVKPERPPRVERQRPVRVMPERKPDKMSHLTGDENGGG